MPSRKNTTLPKAIRDQVIALFAKYRLLEPFILHRTRVRELFVGESPHNLLPSQRKPAKRQSWTVFLAFESYEPAWDGLERIYAFPDERDPAVPRQPLVRLGPDEMVDLKRMPHDLVFRDLQ